MKKERRVQGYPYRHDDGYVAYWDTYGEETFPSRTGGTWHLITEKDIALLLNSANEI